MKIAFKLIILLYFLNLNCFSQEKSEKIIIRGVVKTDNEIPINNAKIFVDNKKLKRRTNKKGIYTIVLAKAPNTIKFKSFKYGTKEIKYKGINLINITFPTEKIAKKNKYRKYNDLFDYLRDQPGVEVSNNIVRVRGVSSFNASTQPIFIVNGKQSHIQGINMLDVKKIKVLRKPDELAIYGSRGGNGVIVIDTH